MIGEAAEPNAGPAEALPRLGRDWVLLEAGCLGQPEDNVESLNSLPSGSLDQVVDCADCQNAATARIHATPDTSEVAAVDVLG